MHTSVTTATLGITTLSAMASLLTKEEAVRFVENSLAISNCQYLLHTDKLNLLRVITLRLYETCPFHNLFLMAESPQERKRPTWEMVKARIISKAGGLCYTINLFTFHLLRALGYHTKLLTATVQCHSNSPHLMLTVMNVHSHGDQFLVDPGMGFPCFEPVDLNFKTHSPTFYQSYMTMKFVREGNVFKRLHRKNNAESFKLFMTWKMDLFEPTDIEHCFDKIYEDPSVTNLHQDLVCMQYRDGRAKILHDSVISNENHRGMLLDHTLTSTGRSLEDCVVEQFPSVPFNVIKAAVRNWRRLRMAKQYLM